MPAPGSSTWFSIAPSSACTETRVVTSLRYVTKSLPPAVLAVSMASGFSGTTSRHLAAPLARGSNRAIFQFGAFALVWMRNASPTFPMTW